LTFFIAAIKILASKRFGGGECIAPRGGRIHLDA